MTQLKTDTFALTLDKRGHFTAFVDRATSTDYLPRSVPAPLLALRRDGSDIAPTALTRQSNNTFTLSYGAATATIDVAVHPTHITFELVELAPDAADLISWGPYPTTIGQTIGETVGVVRDAAFAIGIQALNAKTLGGIPLTDDDVMPSYNIFDAGNYADIAPEFSDQQLYRGNTAVAAPHGSQLQAYCRDRRRDRLIANWGHEIFLAPAYDDGGPVGSKIALFGCPTEQVMDMLAAIEQREGLPHPTLDGVWAKTSPAATASYIIMDFGEDNIDQALDITRAAGLEYLYHSAPFATWGHFQLRPEQFPRGWDGFKACVERAAERNVKIGFHTLSNFTTPNDPYVSPKPDPRLARIGSARLAKAIDAQVKTIHIDAPDFFRKNTTLNAVVIDGELITYKGLSAKPPWRLLQCSRGAFGTQPAAHASGADLGKLLDHGYRVFLTDVELAQEQARRIADFCNHTGARQLSFDGLEGNWSTGMGQYGRTLFTQAWYRALAPELQGQIVNDASNPGHFNWHMYTRMNWGEPWYAGFRDSQTLYRLKNQYYYSRNLMPRMLGWFALRGDTSLEDAEWLLARAAGFDAGFSLATSVQFAGDQILTGNDLQDRGQQSNLQAILNTVHHWEQARMASAFPEHLKAELQDVEREFHLRPTDSGWALHRVHSCKAKLHARKRTVLFDNPHAAQNLCYTVQNAGDKPIASPVLIQGNRRTELGDGPLQPGQIIKRDGQAPPTLYSADWQPIRALGPAPITVAAGPQKLALDWDGRGAGQRLRVEYRTLGAAIPLKTAQ